MKNQLINLREELELIDEVYPKFDSEEYLDGKLQPVFFGSALNNFGVRELLDCFVEIAPSPRPKDSDTRLVDPKEEKILVLCLKSTPIWIQNTETDWLL